MLRINDEDAGALILSLITKLWDSVDRKIIASGVEFKDYEEKFEYALKIFLETISKMSNNV